MRRSAFSRGFSLLFSCVLALCACADDGDGPGPGPSEGTRYVGATRMFTPDGSMGYLFVVDTLEASGAVDLSQALEMSDAWVFGDADPYFYTATIFEPTITRWTLSDDGRPVEGPTLSFFNEGVGGTYTAAFTPIFSRDKAYFADGDSMQVVVWDPAAMIFLRTIPIPAPTVEGYYAWIELAVRADDLVATVYYQSEELIDFGDAVRTYVIDPDTDTIVASHEDTRCGSAGVAGVASDGTVYYSAIDYNATIGHVFGEGYGASACALRMNGDADALDQSWSVDLGAVFGAPAGSAYLVDDDTLLVHVWQTSLVDATVETWTEDRFAPGYLWYRYDIAEGTTEVLPDQTPSSEGGTFRTIDGEVYAFGANTEYTETTVSRLEDDGRFTSGLVVPGWIVTMIRAR